MKEDRKSAGEHEAPRRQSVGLLVFLVILTVFLMIVPQDVSRRHLSQFVTAEEKYLLGVEATLLSIMIVETLVRVATGRLHRRQMQQLGINLRITVRIAGYLIASVCVISILSANPALGISVGTIAGVVVAFATQSIVGSMLATVILISRRIVQVGEEITVSQTQGTVLEIGLLHTIISTRRGVAYIPNSLMVTGIVHRNRRTPERDVHRQAKDR